MSPRPTLLALGETAVRIDFAGGLDRTTIARVRGAARALAEERAARSEALRAVLDLVAVGPSLLVRLDPRSVTEELEREILAICERACSGVEAEPEPRRIEVPITYDGPDLEQVARRSGLDSDEVVRRHLAGDYFVAAVGFAPGFAYLGGLIRDSIWPAARARGRASQPARWRSAGRIPRSIRATRRAGGTGSARRRCDPSLSIASRRRRSPPATGSSSAVNHDVRDRIRAGVAGRPGPRSAGTRRCRGPGGGRPIPGLSWRRIWRSATRRMPLGSSGPLAAVGSVSGRPRAWRSPARKRAPGLAVDRSCQERPWRSPMAIGWRWVGSVADGTSTSLSQAGSTPLPSSGAVRLTCRRGSAATRAGGWRAATVCRRSPVRRRRDPTRSSLRPAARRCNRPRGLSSRRRSASFPDRKLHPARMPAGGRCSRASGASLPDRIAAGSACSGQQSRAPEIPDSCPSRSCRARSSSRRRVRSW